MSRFRGPLADSYPAAAALVIFALVPYLALSAAFLSLMPVLSNGLGVSRQALELTVGMANAAYAFGTVMAVQLAVHLPGRRMLVAYCSLFVVGTSMAALDLTPGLFIAGYVIAGLCTSLMLIAAVPPLVTGWPPSKMPWTAAVMNLCVFGAVAIGPVAGGVQAGAGSWRLIFWLVAGSAVLALALALLTFEDQPPQDHSAPWDWVAVVLAGGGCAAAFFGASELETHPIVSAVTLPALLAGTGMIVALVLYEYHARRPLMPVKQAFTTIPVAGIVIAMCAGAASFAVVELAQTALQSKGSPTHNAMLFWPEFGGALLTAALLGLLLRTRFVPLLAFAGAIMLAGGAAVLTGVTGGAATVVLVGSGLVGLGVGASVSPALFSAGFSLPSGQIQRIFALIELLRGVAAFMAAPVILHLAKTVGGSQADGVKLGLWVCCGIAAGGGLLAACVFLYGRARLQVPELERWERGEQPAWHSPPITASARRDHDAATATARLSYRQSAADQSRRTRSRSRPASECNVAQPGDRQ